MEPKRARRVHAIFKQALDLPEGERDEVVSRASEGDPHIAAGVRRLLAAASRTTEFLEKPALAATSERASHVPDAVGDYLVVAVLGTGGMATVYEAIQRNPNRRVALKVMHQSLSHTDAYMRFRLETETLAKLHHAGIAQIYEAGTASLGQATPSPFFAMELIKNAVTITNYAAQRGLSTRERVEMMAKVCDAVQHGHQHGIIHRDLKPGNILVDGDGHPKVIDFGVARSIENAASRLTKTTDSRHLIGTLNYMSPEQCGVAGDIDIRTDVYSLGVVLYELVCGRLPHDLNDQPLPAALSTIMDERAAPPGLARTPTNRDLEAILLKALSKRRDSRYDSASALASDLRRWLHHQPTEARPASVLDQFRLFARRNRGLVAAGLAIAASVVLVATISTAFAVRLKVEADRRAAAETQMGLERDEARWQAYTAQIAGALSAMKTGEFQQMRSRLSVASHPRRGWEWGFLERLSERSDRFVYAHRGMVRSLAMSPDLSRFVTTAEDGSVRMWNASDLSEGPAYQSETGTNSLTATFAAHGKYVVTGDDDGVVRLLRGDDLGFIAELGRLRQMVRTVIELSEDRVAAAGADGTAQIWDLRTLEPTPFPNEQPGGVQGLAASRDGRLISSFNDAGTIWVWDGCDLSVKNRFTFPARIQEVRFSPAGDLLAASGEHGHLYIWRLSDERLLHTIQATGGVNGVRSLAFSNDGRWIAAGLIHRGIQIHSVADGVLLHTIQGHTEAVSAIAFSTDDSLMYSASWDRTVRLWRTADFATPGGIVSLTGHSNHVRGVAFSPDGTLMVSASRDGTLRCWDADAGSQVATLLPVSERLESAAGKEVGTTEFTCLAFAPDGSRIITGGPDKTVRAWNTITGEATLISDPATSLSAISSVAVDRAGERVASAGADGRVRVWSSSGSGMLLDFKAHDARVNSVRFSPDGTLIASGSRDKTVRVSDAATGTERFHFRGHESDVFDVLFSADGRLLFSGSRDQTIRVWDVATGVCIKILGGHGQNVTCLALTSDATRLAAGSWFGEVLLFDLQTFDLIASFRSHDAAIRGVAFSPDGRWLASASYDGTVKLHDSATRREADARRDAARSARSTAMARLRTTVGAGGLTRDHILEVLSRQPHDARELAAMKKVALQLLTRGETDADTFDSGASARDSSRN